MINFKDDKIYSNILSSEFLDYLNTYRVSIVNPNKLKSIVNPKVGVPIGLTDCNNGIIFLTNEKDYKTLAHEIGHVVFRYLLENNVNFNLLNEAYLFEINKVAFCKFKPSLHYLKFTEFIAQGFYLYVFHSKYFRKNCKYLFEIFKMYNVIQDIKVSNIIHLQIPNYLGYKWVSDDILKANDLIITKVICAVHHKSAKVISASLAEHIIYGLVKGDLR